jgi:8-oxo-dGTP diphosphatase
MMHTVGALFVDRSGRALLGLRAAWKRAWPCHWDLIGGRVEPGESLEQALIREVQEEAGVTPSRSAPLATVAEPRPDLYGEALHHIYAVTAWSGGDPSNACDEHSELRWFSIEEMSELTNIVDADYPRLARLAMQSL